MSRTKLVSGECQHCGGLLPFPAESIGLPTVCPNCGRRTELRLATPPDEPTVPAKTIVYTAIAVLILIGGLVGAMIGVNRLQRTAEQRKAAADSFVQAGLRVSMVTLEKASNNLPFRAVGNVRNETDRRRLGVKVELELLDAAGKRVGTTADHCLVLEPNTEWRFKTPVLVPKVVSVRVLSIQAER